MQRLSSEALRAGFMRLASAEDTTGFLLRGSAVSLVARVAGVVVSYAATLILSRSLGVQAFGAYALALSWALVLVFLARAGLDRTALKYVSIYLDQHRSAAVRGFVRLSTLVIFSLSAATALGILVLTHVGATSLSRDLALPTALLIFPLAALGLNAALLRTAQRIFAAQFYDQILRPAILIVLLLAMIAATGPLSPAKAMMLTGGAAWAALAFSAVHQQRALRDGRGPADYTLWREWMGFSAPILVMSIVQELLNQISIILLGYLDGTAAAGLYSAASRLSSLITFGLVAIVSMTGPMIAAAHSRRDVAEVAHIARLSARFGFLAALCLIVPLAILGRTVLLMFGPGFGDAYPALLLMLLGGIGNAFTGAVAYLMTMTGRHLQALWIFMAALVLSVLLNVLLIPHGSTVGAATASAAATLFWNFAMLVYVRWKLGIDASAVGLRPGAPAAAWAERPAQGPTA